MVKLVLLIRFITTFHLNRATLFNVKCDPIHEFGENHYNEILFNPQGNMVGLCGFGNLRGESLVVEVRCGDMGLGISPTDISPSTTRTLLRP